MLQNREFFKIVSDEILRQIYSQSNRIHSIDSLEIIANKIGLLTAAIMLYRTFTPYVFQESDDGNSAKNNLKKINEDQKDFDTAWNEQVIPMLKEFAFDRKLKSGAKKTQKEMMKPYNQEKKKLKKHEQNPIPKPPNVEIFSDAITIFLESLPSLRLFLAVSEDMLWKLCRLWEGYDSFEYTLKIIQGFVNQNKKLS